MSVSDGNKNKITLTHHDSQVDQALKRLSKSADLKTVLTALQTEYIQVLISTSPAERDKREECYTKIMTLDDLQTWVDNYGE